MISLESNYQQNFEFISNSNGFECAIKLKSVLLNDAGNWTCELWDFENSENYVRGQILLNIISSTKLLSPSVVPILAVSIIIIVIVGITIFCYMYYKKRKSTSEISKEEFEKSFGEGTLVNPLTIPDNTKQNEKVSFLKSISAVWIQTPDVNRNERPKFS